MIAPETVTFQGFEERALAFAFDFDACASFAPPPDVFRECKTGGCYARRVPRVGDLVGGAKVLGQVESLSHDGRRGKVFEIACSGCGIIQLRSASQINASLRRKRTIECPSCVREAASGRHYAYQEHIRERVLDGGPLYTQRETHQIEREVRAALEEEFGELPEESLDFREVESAFTRFYAATQARSSCSWGITPSVSAKKESPWKRTERMHVLERAALRADREAEEADRLRRKKIGEPLAELLKAIDAGDVSAMAKASDIVNGAVRKGEVTEKKEQRERDPRLLALLLKAKLERIELVRSITPPGLDPIDAMVARARLQGIAYDEAAVMQALRNARPRREEKAPAFLSAQRNEPERSNTNIIQRSIEQARAERALAMQRYDERAAESALRRRAVAKQTQETHLSVERAKRAQGIAWLMSLEESVRQRKCPCESGKAFKACHGVPPENKQLSRAKPVRRAKRP